MASPAKAYELHDAGIDTIEPTRPRVQGGLRDFSPGGRHSFAPFAFRAFRLLTTIRKRCRAPRRGRHQIVERLACEVGPDGAFARLPADQKQKMGHRSGSALRRPGNDCTPTPLAWLFAFSGTRCYRAGGSHSTFSQLHDRVAASSRPIRHASTRRPAKASVSVTLLPDRPEYSSCLCLPWLGVTSFR